MSTAISSIGAIEISQDDQCVSTWYLIHYWLELGVESLSQREHLPLIDHKQ